MSLKRLYRLFPSKEQLVVGVLQRRDVQWRQQLAAHVEHHEDPETRILAVFDWLEVWFAEPGFRGCAWINCYGEIGAVSAPVAKQARLHKAELRTYLDRLVSASGLPPEVTDFVALLVEGAIATAGICATQQRRFTPELPPGHSSRSPKAACRHEPENRPIELSRSRIGDR